jgi:hypothetical protein
VALSWLVYIDGGKGTGHIKHHVCLLSGFRRINRIEAPLALSVHPSESASALPSRPTVGMVVSLDLNATDLASKRGLENISQAVYKSRRILVVTGAGISCSCGIPVRSLCTFIHIPADVRPSASPLGFPLIRWSIQSRQEAISECSP